MLAICSICQSRFVSTSDDITAAPCGHTFHYACLLQWLQTSKSCPHCRHKTSERSLLKLFFDVQTDSTEDIGSVHNHNDTLQFQLTLKDKQLKNATEEMKKAQRHTEGTKQECVKLNCDLKKKNATISDLKMQVSYLNNNIKDTEDAKKRAQKAEKKLKTLIIVEKIYFESYADIQETIVDCSQGTNREECLANLATISGIMQRKLSDAVKEKTKYCDENLALKMKNKKLDKSSLLKDTQIESLEQQAKFLQEDIKSLESENRSLSSKVSALRDSIISPSDNVKNRVINRLLTENVVPEKLKRFKDCDESISEEFITPEVIRKKPKALNDRQKPSSDAEETSPYIRVKCSSVNPFATSYNKKPVCTSKKAASSPVVHKSKFHQFPISSLCEDFGYDGLGGHHRADVFAPQPASPIVKKLKRVNIVHKGRSSSAKLVPVQRINDYFKNTFEE